MKIKSFGFILFIIGMAYMVIDGWLVSWWFVPDYRVAGPAFLKTLHFKDAKYN